MDDEEELSPLVTLDLRAIHTVIEETDGDLVMLVDDGDVQIEFGSGLCGTWEQAILGAQRVASTAHEFAEALRLRRPLRSQKLQQRSIGGSTNRNSIGFPGSNHG